MKSFSIVFASILALTVGAVLTAEDVGQLQTVLTQFVCMVGGKCVQQPKVIEFVQAVGPTSAEWNVYEFPAEGTPKRIKITYTVEDWSPVPGPTPIPPSPPGPGPAPSPSLTGFALEVYQQAKDLPAADCKRLATNYETVASMIAAGGIRDTSAANSKLTELNRGLSLSPSVWSDFATWLGNRFNRDAQTLEASRKLMAEVAQGLNSVGAK